jgi:hypothetical protein
MDLKYQDITEKVIGESYEVHKFSGNGFTHFLFIFFMVFVSASQFRK